MAAMPTPPQPKTTTDDPGVTLAQFTAAPTPVVTPQPMRAAISKGTSSSMAIAARSWMVAYSLNVPVPDMPWTGVARGESGE